MKIIKNKKIFIFGFFVLVWSFFIIYGYERYQILNNKNDEIVFFNEQLGVKESSYLNNNINSTIDFTKKDTFLGKIVNADEKKFFKEEGISEIKENNLISNVSQDTKQDTKQDVSQNNNQNLNCGDFKCYTGEEFIELYNVFEKNTGLSTSDEFIYNKEIDPYIRYLAGLRGYKKRIFADEKDIINFLSVRTRKEVKNAYVSMRNEMKKQNISLHFVSGYRNADHQRSIFKGKIGHLINEKVLDGLYDSKINTVLTKSSIPGYSKHHSGYAVDFGCGSDYLVYSFADTVCYDWLSKNNFENAKRFGFIPSYPSDVEKQGPDPEPWEFVWIGVENIK